MKAKEIHINNKFPSGWKVIKNEKNTIAKKGWIAIFGTGSYSEYGHVGLVFETGDTNNYVIIEQNWNGYANKKPTKRVDNYYGLTHFIVPPVAKETAKKDVVKKSAPVQKAPAKVQSQQTIEVIDKEITGYKMKARGYNPKFIVIHNDAGNQSGKQYYKDLVNASYTRLENGIAHAYADKSSIWYAIPDNRIAWHTANITGNTDGWGIEVCQSMSASDKDFLENEKVVFQECARRMKKWGLTPNRNTVRLHMEFVSTACPHRSMVMHTGFDPVRQGRPDQATMNKLKDYFISQIKAYMNGSVPTPKVSAKKPASASTPATRPDSDGWKVNQYGTQFKAEKGTFTPNTAIITRYVGPFTTCPQAGVLQAGQSIKYDEVMRQDGYIWIGYTAYGGKRVYLPVRTWNRTNNKLGVLWGTIK